MRFHRPLPSLRRPYRKRSFSSSVHRPTATTRSGLLLVAGCPMLASDDEDDEAVVVVEADTGTAVGGMSLSYSVEFSSSSSSMARF
jgi:hypothetical protein